MVGITGVGEAHNRLAHHPTDLCVLRSVAGHRCVREVVERERDVTPVRRTQHATEDGRLEVEAVQGAPPAADLRSAQSIPPDHITRSVTSWQASSVGVADGYERR